MADIELFFDPICPWAWVTSRWVQEVADRRGLAVDWRFIALRFVNEERDYAQFPPMYGELHAAGLALLRVAAAARAHGGGEAVGACYAALGTRIHRDRRYTEAREQDRALIEEALAAAGLPAHLADAATSDAHDDEIRAETRIALERAGDDIGTPVVTFDQGRPSEGSFFGPVVDRIPRGEEALALYDTVVALARTPGFLELKRARPGPGPSAVD
jgi:2-hydroxychromene-2-carboxylate isomerase